MKFKHIRFRLRRDEKELFKDISKFILLVSGTTLVAGALVVAPGLSHLLRLFHKKYPQYGKERERTKKLIYKIYNNRLVSFIEKDKKQLLEVTDKGKGEFIEFNIDTIKIKSRKWDGKWRVVIFDIPELKKIAREVLRNKLREIGFVKIQKSVWACPYECQNEVSFIASVYCVEKYVNYLVVERADFSDSLKRYFKV